MDMLHDARTNGVITEIIRRLTDLEEDYRRKNSSISNYAPLPIGFVFISVLSDNPATILGYGTWVAFGPGCTLVSLDAAQVEFDTVRETGGEKTHVISSAEMPSHTHTQNAHTHTQNAHDHNVVDSAAGSSIRRTTGGALNGYVFNQDGTNNGTTTIQAADATATNQNTTATNQNTGGGNAHNNLQPYIVVYMWERTA